MRRRWTIIAIFLMADVLGLENMMQAVEQYPVKPIVFIVPLEAGAGGDIMMRKLVEKASPVLGKPVIVVNKPGAGSSIAYRELHNAKPDGYTIGFAPATIVTNKLQGLSRLDYHDFTILVSVYCTSPIVVASTKAKRPFKTIEEVITFARAHPGEVSIATASVGQSLWIAAMALLAATKIDLNVVLQEGGGGYAVTQAAGGHTDLAVVNLMEAKSQIDAGNLRILAVIGSKRISGRYGDIPTLEDVGYDAKWDSFGVVLGPPKIPKDITDKLAKAFTVAVTDSEFEKFLTDREYLPFYLPPDRVMKYLDERRKSCKAIMKKTGLLKEE